MAHVVVHCTLYSFISGILLLLSFVRIVDSFYKSLEPLFTADPQLLYDFIYICPEDAFKSLFRNIPVYLSLTRLSLSLNEKCVSIAVSNVMMKEKCILSDIIIVWPVSWNIDMCSWLHMYIATSFMSRWSCSTHLIIIQTVIFCHSVMAFIKL